jgi:hypothetical protein
VRMRRREQYRAYPWANMPVAINPNEVRSQTESGWSNPYMPMTNPEAIATMPTDRAINALCCKPRFAIAQDVSPDHS